MKKRILAALVAVTMAVSVFVGLTANAEGSLEEATKVYEENFEGDTNPYANSTQPQTVTIVDDGGSKVAFLPGDPNWGEFKTGTLFEADPSTVYTFTFRIKGSIANAGIIKTEGSLWGDPASVPGPSGSADGRYSDWQLVVGKASGHAAYSLNVIVKREIPSDNVYVDDIVVYEGDYVDAILEAAGLDSKDPADPADPADPTATTAPSASATAATTTAPSVTPATTATAATTTAPSVTPSTSPTGSTGGTTVKKSIKFNKKSVKIKKGKKVTLKVTIKGAKKAKFSVDKKGKKVVKLSKKKAKSVVVTGKKKGKATITAKAAGKKATCKVTVK